MRFPARPGHVPLLLFPLAVLEVRLLNRSRPSMEGNGEPLRNLAALTFWNIICCLLPDGPGHQWGGGEGTEGLVSSP